MESELNSDERRKAASIMGRAKSEKKIKAVRENARKPRPNARKK